MKSKLLMPLCAAMALAGCGGSSGDTPQVQGANLSIAIGDAPVDNASKVVVTVKSLTLKRADGGADVVLPVTDSTGQPLQLNLLDYQGGTTYLALDGATIPAANYSDIILNIDDTSSSASFVDANGGTYDLKVPSDTLKIGGFDASAGGQLAFTIDFNLRKAMTYNPGPQRYILKPRGVSLKNTAVLGQIGGTVAANLATSCNTGTDSSNYGFVYLYSGHGLTNLADDFDTGASGVPSDAAAPVASVAVTLADDGNPATTDPYTYQFGLLMPGDYTVAFSCDGINDQPETYEGLTIPNPAGLSYELNLTDGGNLTQDFNPPGV